MKKIILFLIAVVFILVIIFWPDKEFLMAKALERMKKCIQGNELKSSCDWTVKDDYPALCWFWPPTSTTDVGGFNARLNQKVEISGTILDDCAKLDAPHVWAKIDWGDVKSEGFVNYYKCEGYNIILKKEVTFTHTYTFLPPVEKFYIITLTVIDTNQPANETIMKWRVHVTETGEYDYEPGGGGDDGGLIIGPLKLKNPLKGCANITCIIDKIITFIFTVAVILLPILMIAAGIMFLVAAGDPAKIKNAKKLILYALIGFGIIFLSRLFIKLLQQIFRVKTQT